MGLAKKISALAAGSRPFRGVLELVERRQGAHDNVLRVLTYHRVDWPAAEPTLNPGLVSATPPEFEQQMRFVAERYRAVTMEAVLSAVRAGKPLGPRAVLITFDDAYRDFQRHAWPVLKSLGLPATMFVATAFPGQPHRAFWWDRLHHAIATARRPGALATAVGTLPLSTDRDRARALRRLRDYVKAMPHDAAMTAVDRWCEELHAQAPQGCVMNWTELKQLAGEGLTLGAHTRNHPLMNRISSSQSRAEALGSLDDLRHQIGHALPIFAYPSGGFDAAAVRTLREAGFELAFTTGRGLNDLASADPLRLKRINVGGQTTLPLLRAQLLRWSAGRGRRTATALPQPSAD